MRFHPLTVAAVEPLTDDAAAITFAVPPDLTEVFAFAPGQSLTVRVGAERRSYSVCAPAGFPPRIGVRAVAGGAVSGHLVHGLRPGDVLAVAPPGGTFTPDLGAAGHHVLIAAGSGITPLLSIAASLLDAHPQTTVTLVYGNRRSDSVMFADDVADLKDAHPARMQLVHVLSREPQRAALLSGRLDAAKLRTLLPATVAVPAVAHWWLCGPYGLLTGAAAVLAELGVPADRVHRELFFVGDDAPPPAAHPEPPAGAGAEVTVLAGGRSGLIRVPAGSSILDAAQHSRPDLPYACKGGVCGTCRALVTAGEVRMRRNYALEPAEVAAGYVLTCQALPVSPQVAVDYDC